MAPPAPIYTAHLLAPIHAELVALLHSLSPEQWLLPTSARRWRVRDVVAHLLDGDLRRLSYHRDGLPQPTSVVVRGYDDLVAYLNRMNDSWVTVADRLSPRVLTCLVEDVGRQTVDFLASLPPHEQARWPVAWAGESESENWMDVGRNYTEYWHHQQQIREAVGAPPLTDARWLQSVVALGVRAVAPALARRPGLAGATVHVSVSGRAGGSWWVHRGDHRWTLCAEAPVDAEGKPRPPTATVELDAESAARIWYAGREPQTAAARAKTRGDADLAQAVLTARALMV